MATPDVNSVLELIKQQQGIIGGGAGSDILNLAEKVLTNGATVADGASVAELIKKYSGLAGQFSAGNFSSDLVKQYADLAAQFASGKLSGDLLAQYTELAKQFANNPAILAGLSSAGNSGVGNLGALAGLTGANNLSALAGLSSSFPPGFIPSGFGGGTAAFLSKVVAPANASGIIPGVSIDNNLFKTDLTTKGFGVQALTQKASNKVNEIGIFAVDDATGKIGTLAPGSTEYLKAALDSAKSIFSTLAGDFLNTAKQEFAVDPSKNYQFFEIQDGSISDLQQQLASGKTPGNILFSLPDKDGNSPIQVTNNADGSGYNVAINNSELVLDVLKLGGAVVETPIGSGSQRAPEGRTIDLTAFVGQTLKADIVTKSSAAYSNNVGFYVVEDAIGSIKLADGTFVKPGDVTYAAEAVKNALTNSTLQASKTENSLDRDIAGGRIYAPVVIAQGTFDEFLAKNASNGGGKNDVHAYFNYIGANSDKVDHFRLVGSNTFGVEDVYGGGDRDFNDLVVSMNVKAPAVVA
jgi:hypothetical protein